MPDSWSSDDVSHLIASLNAANLSPEDLRLLKYILEVAKESISTNVIRKQFEDAYEAGPAYAAVTPPILDSIRKICGGIR